MFLQDCSLPCLLVLFLSFSGCVNASVNTAEEGPFFSAEFRESNGIGVLKVEGTFNEFQATEFAYIDPDSDWDYYRGGNLLGDEWVWGSWFARMAFVDSSYLFYEGQKSYDFFPQDVLVPHILSSSEERSISFDCQEFYCNSEGSQEAIKVGPGLVPDFIQFDEGRQIFRHGDDLSEPPFGLGAFPDVIADSCGWAPCLGPAGWEVELSELERDIQARHGTECVVVQFLPFPFGEVASIEVEQVAKRAILSFTCNDGVYREILYQVAGEWSLQDNQKVSDLSLVGCHGTNTPISLGKAAERMHQPIAGISFFFLAPAGISCENQSSTLGGWAYFADGVLLESTRGVPFRVEGEVQDLRDALAFAF